MITETALSSSAEPAVGALVPTTEPAQHGGGATRQAMELPSQNTSREIASLEGEVSKLSEALAIKFEQLTLIHELSEQLEIQEDSSEVCQQLLDDLLPCIDANAMVIELFTDEEHQVAPQTYFARAMGLGLAAAGEESSIAREASWLKQVADQCEATLLSKQRERERVDEGGVIVSNLTRLAGSNPGVESSSLFRCVVVPIKRRNMVLGRMIAIRNGDQEEFGTIEADLLRSMTSMLAVHWLNQRHYKQMQEMFEGTVGSLVSALDAKDAYTCGHSSRVAELSVELAAQLGYDEDGLTRIRMAGILHDIGKIGIEDSVLCKPGRLTDDEFEKIKQHPVLGYEILKGIGPFRQILPAVRHHHESWDGSGYPDGLAGAAIPRDAQVMAVADAFDAMTSDRPYRNGMPLEKVMAIFLEGRGRQWAADVVDAMLDQSEAMYEHVKR